MPEFDALGPLAGTVIVVFLFLKHLSDQRKHDKHRDEEHSARTKEIVDNMRDDSQTRKDEVLKCVGENTIALTENSKVLGGTTVVLGQATNALRELKK